MDTEKKSKEDTAWDSYSKATIVVAELERLGWTKAELKSERAAVKRAWNSYCKVRQHG